MAVSGLKGGDDTSMRGWRRSGVSSDFGGLNIVAVVIFSSFSLVVYGLVCCRTHHDVVVAKRQCLFRYISDS